MKLIQLLVICSALWGASDASFAWRNWSSAVTVVESQSNRGKDRLKYEEISFLVEKVNQMKWEAQSQTERACLEFLVLGLLIHWNLRKKDHAQAKTV